MITLTIRQKLTFSYIILIVATVLIIGIVVSVVFSRQIMQSSVRQINLRIDKISSKIENQLITIMKITEEVSENYKILHELNTPSSKDTSPAKITELRSIIRSTEQRSPLIERIILINHNLEILDPIYQRPLYASAILGDDDFIEFLSKKYFYYFAKPGSFPIDIKNNDNMTIALYQRLLDENYWLMGYQISLINKKMLFTNVWSSNRDQIFSGINIFNERNELLFANGLTLPLNKISRNVDFSKIAKSVSINATIGNQKCLVFIKLLPSVNWFVTGIIPYSIMFKNLNFALQLIILTGILFTLFTGLLSYFIAKTITKPIFKITQAMHSYEKTGSLEGISIRASGELKYMSDVYNKLVSQINNYIKNIYQEQEKIRSAELKSLQYELDYLQAQINPHFIHNTLNAIGYQAEKDGNMVVYESLKSFNILLRAAISGTRDLIPLKEELKLTRNFIKIQRLRYGDTFNMRYDIPDSLLKKNVPKLILQPLVENAVFHGIEPSERFGEITIAVYEKEHRLYLEVRDNGAGMDTSLNEGKRQFNKIGLQNIEERIKILFGSSYGLFKYSKKGEGTIITITIPDTEKNEI